MSGVGKRTVGDTPDYKKRGKTRVGDKGQVGSPGSEGGGSLL